MALQYKDIATVPEVAIIPDDATIFVNDNGVLKQAPANVLVSGSPGTDMPHAQLTTDANGNTQWTPLLAYKEIDVADVLPETLLETDEEFTDEDGTVVYTYILLTPTDVSLSINQTYRITLSNSSVDTTALYADGVFCLGNLSLLSKDIAYNPAPGVSWV